MDCPVCKNVMITLELNEVEVDYCTGCDGIWLDAGELELLLGSHNEAQQLLESFRFNTISGEKRRKCPICYRKMRKINVGITEPFVLIDKCPKEHGLWFDRGELQEIAGRASLDGENRISDLLTEIFNAEQTEQAEQPEQQD